MKKWKKMKIWNDTLKNKDGKYSRKSITALISFVLSAIIGLAIVTSDYWLPEAKSEINRYAISVFFGFLGLGGGTLGLTVVDKIKNPSK